MQGASNIAATPRRQTAASRTVNHYIGKDPEAAPMNLPIIPKISKELSARLRGTPPAEETGLRSTKIKLSKALEEVVPVPRKRRVFPEHEGKYKITMPSGKTEKTKKILAKKQIKSQSSVFDCHGSETRLITVTESGLVISSPSKGSVFNRLGGKTAIKREVTSTSVDLDSDDEEDGDQLEYAGVLKSSLLSLAKKPKVIAQKKKLTLRKQATVKAPQKPVVQTAGILSEDSRFQLNKKIKDRLGQKSASQEVTSTTEDPLIFSNPGTFHRLGPKKQAKLVKKQASPVGVFGRLGKQLSST